MEVSRGLAEGLDVFVLGLGLDLEELGLEKMVPMFVLRDRE